MRFIVSIALILMSCLSVVNVLNAQETEPEYYIVVEEMPLFPGCLNMTDYKAEEECSKKKMFEYLAHVKYPQEARNKGWQGKVYVRFIIEKDGKITNVEIEKSSEHLILDNAALTHIQSMPNWIPGRKEGKTVRVQFAVPFMYKLHEPQPIDDGNTKKKKKKKKNSK